MKHYDWQNNKIAQGNYGWYIVPFSVESERNEEFRKYIDSHYEGTDRINNVQFIFSYIKKMFTSRKVKCYEIEDGRTEMRLDFGIINDVRMESVSLEKTELFLFSDYLGFVVYLVNYNDLSLKEIESFAYQFRRTHYTKYDNQELHNSNMEEYTKHLLGDFDFVHPFFYSSLDYNSNCNVLQLIYYNSDEEQNYEKHAYLLGRGYADRGMEVYSTEDSDVDISYKQGAGLEWRACQLMMTAIVKLYASPLTEADRGFYTNAFVNSVNTNYLCLYLILLNQRYSMLYLLSKLVQIEKDADIREVEIIEEQLNDFRASQSFFAVSNEQSYQNLYNRMTKVLDIEKLIQDVDDSSQCLQMHDRKEDEKREKMTNKILFVISALAIASFFIDSSDYIDKCVALKMKSTEIGQLGWIGFFIALIIGVGVGVYIIIKKYESKHGTRRHKKERIKKKNGKENSKTA